jgi:hypothetical protein
LTDFDKKIRDIRRKIESLGKAEREPIIVWKENNLYGYSLWNEKKTQDEFDAWVSDNLDEHVIVIVGWDNDDSYTPKDHRFR